ncbi:MAG: cyclase family protein [Flavobacteriia bacterium]|nr:cyclase family protein [Flavobacteriia bacterium]
MKALIETSFGLKKIDLSSPIGIHLEIENAQSLAAWYVGPPSIGPHKTADFVGSISEGAAVNFNDIAFNPHAHGTHTECVGHILEGDYSIMQSMSQFIFEALVLSIAPKLMGGDLVIDRDQISGAIAGTTVPEVLVIRTLPNEDGKKLKNYSHTNPAYLSEAAAIFIRELGVQHLVVDLPSIDKEEDGGALLAHKAFWNVGGVLRIHATITEFVYVPSEITDGPYALQFGLAPFVNDATPSSVYLYAFENSSSDF